MSQTYSYYSTIPITITTTTINTVILTFTVTVGAPFQGRKVMVFRCDKDQDF